MIRKLICCSWWIIGICTTAKAQEVPKLRINPAQAYGGVVSDYFDEVNYIPLQTTRESLFGAIADLIITDSSFVVSDRDTHAVLFFNKDGSYITKVEYRDDEYPNVSYEASTNRIIIYVYDRQNKKTIIQYYNKSGAKLDNHLNIESSELNRGMRSLGEGFYLKAKICFLPPGKAPADTVAYSISIYKNDSLYKSFFPFIPSQIPCKCALGYWPKITPSEQDSVVYITFQYGDAIYRVSRDTAQKIYTYVFPFNRVLAKKYIESTDMAVIDSLRNNIYKSENLITGISNIYFQNDLILFKIDQRGYIIRQGTRATRQYNLIYNLKTGKLVSLERITPDEKSYFLPLIGGNNISVKGLIHHDNYFYGYIPSLYLFAAQENTKDKLPQYPPTLKKYFKTEDRKSNPVIVEMKLKRF